MGSQLNAITYAALDPRTLSIFWSQLLNRDTAGNTLLASSSTDFPIQFVPTEHRRLWPNRFHFDLTSSSLDEQGRIVDKALTLGASHLDVGQLPDEQHVVLADPEGNEFCVIEPNNKFLANTGAIGALSGDGTRDVGHFWSAALDWPLIWDQNQETAIQAPAGGTKFTWGGPPVAPKHCRMRIGLQLRTGNSPESETLRLLALGARDLGQISDNSKLFTDPDDNEFSLVWSDAPPQ